MKKADDIRETPPDKFAAVAKLVGGFTLDACATHYNAKCATYFTEHGLFRCDTGPELCVVQIGGLDGLRGSWEGERVWCNPPFSGIGEWVAKAHASSHALIVVMLVPSTRREQAWWQSLVEPYRDGRADLVPGWKLSTHDMPGRWHFLEDGKPIVGKDPTKPGFGKLSAPKFGVTLLVWTH